MHWVFLLLALGALVIAFKTTSVGLLALSLLAALVLILAFVMKLAAERVGSRTRDEQLMLDPGELRRLREQAEARKIGADSQGDTQG